MPLGSAKPRESGQFGLLTDVVFLHVENPSKAKRVQVEWVRLVYGILGFGVVTKSSFKVR